MLSIDKVSGVWTTSLLKVDGPVQLGRRLTALLGQSPAEEERAERHQGRGTVERLGGASRLKTLFRFRYSKRRAALHTSLSEEKRAPL